MSRFQTQTIFVGDEQGRSGNCTQAAVATLLGLPLNAVPDFNNENKDAPHLYWQHIEDFFNQMGYEFRVDSGLMVYEGLYLASGPSERGTNHMVVLENGKLFWDPHPSRAGLKATRHTYKILPLDPANFSLKTKAVHPINAEMVF